MKLVDEFRDPAAIAASLDRVTKQCSRRWVIMDVCGGQTHALLKHGLEPALEESLELLHGPGCPVCVTPAAVLDEATELALSPGVTLCSFGDMLRVPGNSGSLLQARARGGDVQTVYSPLDAVALAARNPDREVVFLAVGFETTAPATALAILQAHERGLRNFSVLAHHVRVEPAMRTIAGDPASCVQGFLAAGHVCTVTGYEEYHGFVRDTGLPVVVTGFEPLDLLQGLEACVQLLEAGDARVVNAYDRCARPEGNAHARHLIDTVFQVADVPWRGLGVIPNGGLVISPAFSDWDARVRHRLAGADAAEADGECQSGKVLTGRIKPPECPLFGKTCTPETPAGAPMVSSEGACAAYFAYALSGGLADA
jgi:hydrogenase expression/formation protein HypD